MRLVRWTEKVGDKYKTLCLIVDPNPWQDFWIRVRMKKYRNIRRVFNPLLYWNGVRYVIISPKKGN